MTSEMPWVKVFTEMLDDPKLSKLRPATKWRFVELLLLAGECDTDGWLCQSDKPMTVEQIAWRLREPVEELAPELQVLVDLGLVEIDDGSYYIRNFSKRQGRPQHEKREQWRKWQDKHRGKTVSDDTANVMPDTSMSQAPRGEERRGEEEEEEEEEGEGEHERGGANAPAHTKSLVAIGVLKKISHLNPPVELYEDLTDLLGASPDEPKLRACLKEWVKRGYKRTNWAWALEWYKTGIPERTNGHGGAEKKSAQQILAEHRKTREAQHGK